MERTVVTSEQMKDAGFVYDPTHQGHERWTHFLKCITCLRAPYMTDAQWEAEKSKMIDEAKRSPSV